MDKKETKQILGLLSVIVLLLWFIAAIKVYGLIYIMVDGPLFYIAIILMGILFWMIFRPIYKMIKEIIK